MTRRDWVMGAVGAVAVLLGFVWFLQGLGLIGGSSMSNNTTWVVIGAAVALVGLYLAGSAAIRGARSTSKRGRAGDPAKPADES